MESVAAGKYPDSACATPCELDRCFHSLGTAVREDDVSEPCGSHSEQSLRKLSCDGGNRCNDKVRPCLASDGFQCPPNRIRIVAERDSAELSDEIGVAISIGVDQVTPLTAHKYLVKR